MHVGLMVYGMDRPTVGITRYTGELTCALTRQKSELRITLLTAGSPGFLATIPEVKVQPLPGCRLLPGLMTLGNVWLPWLAQQLKLDLIHDPTGVTPCLFGSSIARLVVTVHDVFAWSLPGYSSLLDRLIYRSWLPQVLKSRAGAVMTVSRQSQQDIVRFLGFPENKIHRIPYGVNPKFSQLPVTQVQKHLQDRFNLTSPYILYVGALTRRKNIERAVQAFSSLTPVYPDLRFVLAGPRSWAQTPLGGLIAELDIADKIILTGPLTDRDLPVLYNGSLAFIFPSLYEGFGLPVLEAMACGVPVVTSNVSSLPEVAGEAALLVDPLDVTAIAAAISRLIDDPELRRELSQRGLERARQFTWDRTARETIQVYNSVLAGR
jgi:glycosyltransferase involved in cell wall biosynthesis